MVNLSIRMHVLAVSALSALRDSIRQERGQDLIEYALIGGLVAVALIAGFLLLNGYIVNMVKGIGNCVDFNSATTCVAGP